MTPTVPNTEANATERANTTAAVRDAVWQAGLNGAKAYPVEHHSIPIRRGLQSVHC